jgi:hypothetical protein
MADPTEKLYPGELGWIRLNGYLWLVRDQSQYSRPDKSAVKLFQPTVDILASQQITRVYIMDII